ncbi:oligopeptide/dipeptide ABC transporter, ATPase subunit [Syntrophobotulus glycolicus DSM 8271]|uniref:Nickel import system ATP-binding protein NikD n=1 Tax=Syntrophobotulus glycolicus (strain DSM 8271 / FlGlyR) TaxID=645991 RepID=F0T100_SYNGF|nr:ABC transporter ATP-binding protein [Syntrophobotulus glycolicus]ADY57371.1 oligopeptide/dipeptide ABC transporter, ATPase subunit [Syntrophobotulus glycolicus DSM 8271]
MVKDGTPPILEIENLAVSFRQYEKGLRQRELEVISSLSIQIQAGEILAIVGSSGSGKSLLAHAILGILPSNARVSGSLKYRGRELTSSRQEKLRGRELVLVPQSVTYLDPLMKIGAQVRGTNGSAEAQRRVFEKYQLGSETEEMYPFQLSGGMARRVLVATAVIGAAGLIIADEPTPGLHPAVAEETMRHLRALADEGRSVMLITHELDLACRVADRIAVFYGGTTVEVAPVADFIQGREALRHPYSKALWNALPQNGFQAIPGSQPYAGRKVSGCVFAARCQIKTEECNRPVAFQELRGGTVRCCHAT